MAKKDERWGDNAPGAWYVDKSCILCSLCEELAPQTFKQSPEGDHDFVHRQPQTEEEISAAREAMEQCPVEAIGNDGST